MLKCLPDFLVSERPSHRPSEERRLVQIAFLAQKLHLRLEIAVSDPHPCRNNCVTF
jgi:hypothetical protein